MHHKLRFEITPYKFKRVYSHIPNKGINNIHKKFPHWKCIDADGLKQKPTKIEQGILLSSGAHAPLIIIVVVVDGVHKFMMCIFYNLV